MDWNRGSTQADWNADVAYVAYVLTWTRKHTENTFVLHVSKSTCMFKAHVHAWADEEEEMKMGGLWLWLSDRWCPDWDRWGVKPSEIGVKKKHIRGRRTRETRWGVAKVTEPEMFTWDTLKSNECVVIVVLNVSSLVGYINSEISVQLDITVSSALYTREPNLFSCSPFFHYCCFHTIKTYVHTSDVFKDSRCDVMWFNRNKNELFVTLLIPQDKTHRWNSSIKSYQTCKVKDAFPALESIRYNFSCY